VSSFDFDFVWDAGLGCAQPAVRAQNSFGEFALVVIQVGDGLDVNRWHGLFGHGVCS
jgi:hypothetical protein